MKNIQLLSLEKYKNEQLYQLIEQGVYKNLKDNSYRVAFSFELEGEEIEDSQYPLEDILDKYTVHVSDFIDSDENEPHIMKVELSGTNLKDLKEATLMEGKRVYNQAYVNEKDGEKYIKLIIE